MLILTIEDDPDDRSLLSRAFARFAPGQLVHFAGDEHEARAFLAKRRPDLVLMDIRLGAIDGFRLTQRLREAGLMAGVPVIFLTGSDTVADYERCQAVGALGMQTKPSGLLGMRLAIEQMLSCYNEHRLRPAVTGSPAGRG